MVQRQGWEGEGKGEKGRGGQAEGGVVKNREGLCEVIEWQIPFSAHKFSGSFSQSRNTDSFWTQLFKPGQVDSKC